MAEKVSLLSSLPTVPVADKVDETDSKIVLLSSSEKEAKEASLKDSGASEPTSLKLLSSSASNPNKKTKKEKAALAAKKPTQEEESEAATVETVASTEALASDDGGGSSFGVALVFGSFVLIFVLVAVGAAVVTRRVSGAKQPVAAATPPDPEPDEKPKPAPKQAPPPVAQAQNVDPVVDFINSTPEPKAIPHSKKLPPRKPTAANGANGEMPRPPKKPGSAAVTSKPLPKAPNAPSSIKAPSKPKKRF